MSWRLPYPSPPRSPKIPRFLFHRPRAGGVVTSRGLSRFLCLSPAPTPSPAPVLGCSTDQSSPPATGTAAPGTGSPTPVATGRACCSRGTRGSVRGAATRRGGSERSRPALWPALWRLGGTQRATLMPNDTSPTRRSVTTGQRKAPRWALWWLTRGR